MSVGEFKQVEFDAACKDSGMKYSAIASKLGMTDNTFRNKRKGRSEWKRSEIQRVVAILNLTKAQSDKIFCLEGR